MAVNIGPKIGIDGEKEYRKAINDIIQQQKTLKSEMQKTESEWGKTTSAEKKASDQKKNLNEQIKVQEERVKKLNEMLQESTKKYGENDAKTLKWKEAVNQATAELNEMQSALKEIPNGLQIMGDRMDEVGQKIKSTGEALAPFSAAAAGGLTYAVKTASDFEAQMDKVQAISGANAETMEVLETTARDWGKRTKFSATEAGEAMEYMAMAGWKDQQMVAGIGPILNLATAAGEELGTTSDIVTDALTAFGLTAEDTSHFSDVLAAASSNANTNVSMMGESFKYAAPVAGSLGYSVEDVAVALGLMANAGIKSSQAGTSLRNIFQRMAKPTKESETAMNMLGISLQDDEGHMYSFMEVMEQLRDSMEGIKLPEEDVVETLAALDEQFENGVITEKQWKEATDEVIDRTFGAEEAEKARAAAMLGGARAMSGLLAITNASEADFEKLAGAVSHSSDTFAMLKDGSIVPLNDALTSGQKTIGTYNGTAEAMAAVMKDNLNGQIEELKSAIDELAISIGKTLAPTLKEIVGHIQGVVYKLNSLDPETKEMIATVGVIVAALSPVLIIVGSLVSAVRSIIGTVGKLIPAIAGLNPAIALAVAAIAALVAIGVVLYQNWDTIKAKAAEFAANVSQKWSALCGYLKQNIQLTINDLTRAKDSLVKAWEDLKNKMNAIKENIVQAWENMKSNITTKVEGIKTTVSTKFDAIKTKITTTIESARDKVKEAIDKIKGFFDFKWELPKLKLPHFSIDGEFSLNPPSIPHIGVEWYAKAMQNGVILRSPTIFGAANGNLLGAGEAGPEVVVGASSLYDMIRGAVASTTNNYGGNNVYVYGAPGQDVHELAREIASIINADVQAEGAVW